MPTDCSLCHGTLEYLVNAAEPWSADAYARCPYCHPMAKTPHDDHRPASLPERSGDADALLNWAVERWHAEVAHRPLINVHRRSLDDAWRQVMRRLGADDVVLCGPRHDDLLANGARPGDAT
jgi:hypothetical protein